MRAQLRETGLQATAARTGGEMSRSLWVDLASAAVTTRPVGGAVEHL